MPPLATSLRNDLESVVKKARVIAERGAQSALEALTVHEARSGNHLDAAKQNLRKRLRAHSQQLGDVRKANGEQAIGRLIRECAYEHWHRMLFARFLAENDLLIHPEHNVSVSLDDVLELAREQGIDQWELASRFATRMLPQIFRPDDPVLAVALPRERTLELEQLLESLPAETFKADDSLGWVYQFWQAEEKDRVNASGEKITGETLPAVTQLFTEHYMVLFLLHNTIGAWWAAKRLNDEATKRRSEEAKTEADVRVLVNLPDYPFEYLRFVREQSEGDEDDKATGPWRPAAGVFEGWPHATKDLKALDPCCGSGHFLVAAFELLVRLRMAEEGTSLEAAIRSVLADNLFGLELDARCTQIAAFNLALAAWRMAGRPIDLPTLSIACSGLGPHTSEEEWLRLAEQSGIPMPTLGREPIKNGLLNLHALFSKAPTLGSLIDPNQVQADLITADHQTLQPYLAAALAAEDPEGELHERAVAAAGMVKAADLLAGEYTLVITNVPYLNRNNHGDLLKSFAESYYPDSKTDLTTMFIERLLAFSSRRGSIAVVCSQYWLFLVWYRRLREKLLTSATWPLWAKLGPGAFETITGEVVNVALMVASPSSPKPEALMLGIDASTGASPSEKAALLKSRDCEGILQSDQRRNPDAIIRVDRGATDSLLSEFAMSYAGVCTGDYPRFGRSFNEVMLPNNRWRYQQTTSGASAEWAGLSRVLRWDGGNGELRSYVAARLGEKKVGSWLRGDAAWGRPGICVSLMTSLPVSLYAGELFDDNVAVLQPRSPEHLAALFSFCASPDFGKEVRKVNPKLAVKTQYLLKIHFDVQRWSTIATDKYGDGTPKPQTDDPTQWVFHGWPGKSTEPIQVSVARLLGYRWPAERDQEMVLSDEARGLARKCDELLKYADGDGIVCIPAVRGERPAADRLAALLSACGIRPDRDLDAWLRERFFEEHCDLFHHRPFIWHIWDGRKDGFHALVNYHKLAAPGDAGGRLLTALIHSYLGDWIRDQRDQVGDGKPGAEARLTAALDLKAELEKILAGEPPYDIFVRWKALREQPIGWNPDVDDGVRLNIRPFLMAKDVGRKGAGILRCKPKRIDWGKDRGNDPEQLCRKDDFPWFWGCDPEKHPAHRTNFAGGIDFDGNRWNDLHYTTAFKQAARDRQQKGARA